MRNALFILLFGVCLGACSHSVVTEASYHVVPLPQQIEINQKGEGFTLTHHTQLTVGDEVLKTSVGYFAQRESSEREVPFTPSTNKRGSEP